MRQVIQADADLITQSPPPVLIDEWQLEPPVWDRVRRAVDADSAGGRFLLTGSATPGDALTHSGAGRIVTLRGVQVLLDSQLAEMYAARGGEVLMAGKPFAPIYDLALAEAQRITARDIDRPDILAIGDGPETDIRGAADYGLDALLVAEGVTDASEGLYVAEAEVLRAVPHARIVATVHDLAWM